MSEDNVTKKTVSFTSPKNELWKAYKELEKKLSEKEELQLKPQKIVEEKVKKDTIQKVEGLSLDSVSGAIQTLKSESTLILGKLQENLEKEIRKYEDIQKAINVKENEIKEIFEIEKSAYSLAALIEAQNVKKKEFEEDLLLKKETLLKETERMRNIWENEKKERETEKTEWDEKEKKRRQREKEEFDYLFKREKQHEQDKLKDELLKEEKDLTEKLDKKKDDLDKRESVLAEKEDRLNQLEKKVEQFQQELSAAVAEAVNETTKKLQVENKSKQEYLIKEFEGQKNVFATKIESYEKIIAEQDKKITELSQKLDDAYARVQDVAVKTIEGASSVKALNELQKTLSEKYYNKSKE